MKQIGIIFLILAISVSGCGLPSFRSYTRISKIKDKPEKYENKRVLIEGKVIETLSIPFVQKGMYQLADDTGKIW